MAKKTMKFDWKKMILGAKRPLIAIIGFAITTIAVKPQWAWIGGIGAERIWATIEWYMSK